MNINMKVEIRRNEDGLIASSIWPDFEFHAFWWQEGNASCDCNRELFFIRAMEGDEDFDSQCGDTRYSVRVSNSDTGEVLYDELSANESDGMA